MTIFRSDFLNVHKMASAAVALIAMSAAAQAQNAIADKAKARLAAASEKIKIGCNLDLQKFCGTVTPGEGRLLLCIMAHENKLGAKCEYTLYQASRNLERTLNRVAEVADACASDIEAKCAALQPGQGRIAQCLVTNKAALTPTCQDAIAKFPLAD